VKSSEIKTATTSSFERLMPHPILLAPMVGITHFVVRRALQEYLPKDQQTLWPTEMLSSRRVPSQRKNQAIEVMMDDHDQTLCPQLLGNEEGFIRDSIARLVEWGASAIDINMGCPVSRALKHNYGVALMGDADYAAQVTEFATRHSPLPVSVKLRAGLQNDREFLVKFAKKIEASGASWITLHPRTAAEKRRGVADWDQIKMLKGEIKIPLIGNGDIQTWSDVERMRRETQCDRVMVGRALLGKPWLLQRMDIPDPYVRGETYGKFLLRVLELSREYYAESLGMRRLRFLVHLSCVWLEFGHTLYSSMAGAVNYDDAHRVLTDFFSTPQKQSERSQLRA